MKYKLEENQLKAANLAYQNKHHIQQNIQAQSWMK